MRRFFLWTGSLLLVATAAACDQPPPVTSPAFQLRSPSFVVEPADACGDALVVPFLAGQTNQVGTISVVHSEDELTVYFKTTDGWRMSETHLAVVTSVADFPTNKSGNPQVGHFPLKMTHDPGVTEYSYTIDLESLGIEEGDAYYVSAHAEVVNDDGGSESAWGEGTRFVTKGNWAMYFAGEVQPCTPPPGTDIVVFNDINPFDNGGMSLADNHILVRNLVNYVHPGPRGSATTIWFDRGRNYRCGGECSDGALAAMRTEIQNAGFTIANVASFSGSIIVVPADVKVIFFWTPRVAFTSSEVNVLKQFAADGGRVVYIGEWQGYYGTGIQVENAFLLDMGAVMTNIGQAVDCGYNNLPAASLRPHQITAGMTSVRIACASVIVPGPQDYPLFYDQSNTKLLAGVATIDITPIPLALSRMPGIQYGIGFLMEPAAPADPGLNINSSTGR